MALAPTLTRHRWMRVWLPVCLSLLMAIAVAVAIVSGSAPEPTATMSADMAPASIVAESPEEPWVPGVITFSGERPQAGPLVLEDLDPNCPCMPR